MTRTHINIRVMWCSRCVTITDQRALQYSCFCECRLVKYLHCNTQPCSTTTTNENKFHIDVMMCSVNSPSWSYVGNYNDDPLHCYGAPDRLISLVSCIAFDIVICCSVCLFIIYSSSYSFNFFHSIPFCRVIWHFIQCVHWHRTMHFLLLTHFDF